MRLRMKMCVLGIKLYLNDAGFNAKVRDRCLGYVAWAMEGKRYN